MATPPTFVTEYESAWNTSTTPLTISVTVNTGDVLVVGAIVENFSTSLNTPTGGGLTYALQQSAGTSNLAPVYVWTATASSSQTFTLSLSKTSGTTDLWGFNCLRFSGSSGVGQSSSTSSSTSAAPSLGLTTTGDNSAVVCFNSDWSASDGSSRVWRTVNGIAPTAGNSLEVTYFRDPVHYVSYAAYWNDAGAAGGKTVGLTTPSQQYSIVAVEVLGTAASAPAFPPNLEQRRRLLVAPRLARGVARISTPVRAQVNPPFPIVGVHQPRELRGKLARRGECWMPIPVQVIVAAPPYPTQPERGRIKVLRQFRGRMSAPLPDQAPAPPPVRARAKGFRARTRTEAVAPVPVQVAVAAPPYPLQSVRTRLRGLRLFRPHAVAPVPAQVVAVPPSYPPQSVRTRLRGLRIFRARAAALVPAQVSVVPPAFVPLTVRARLKFAKAFRGRAVSPPVDQLLAPPAPHVRPRGMAPRRGHAAMPASPQVTATPPAYPVRPVRQRLKGLRLSRPREAMPVPPQVIIVPPAYVPVLARFKRRLGLLFRGQAVTPVAPVCDCATHRPNLGTTSRPGSGITARPDGGTTSRPCSCND